MPSEISAVEKTLALLEDWGWETGHARLQQMIANAPTEKEQQELQLCAGWLAMERGHFDNAFARLNVASTDPALRVWALIGSAFVLLREKDYASAYRLIDEAAGLHVPANSVIPAYLAHLRGTLHYHVGNDKGAKAELFRALSLFTQQRPGYGRVLDTLGMVYMTDNDFYLSRLLYERALVVKETFKDTAGLALTYGQLGRLCLDHGLLNQADEFFRRDQELCWQLGDIHGVAMTSNALGQVALARGQWAEAAALLDDCIEQCVRNSWRVREAFARKDRALACLRMADVNGAETQIRIAEEIFSQMSFEEGTAHAATVRGMLSMARGQHQEAADAFHRARLYFQELDEFAEVARVQREEARLLNADERSAKEAAPTYLAAHRNALKSLRFCLAEQIEQEFRAAFPGQDTRQARSPAGQEANQQETGHKELADAFSLLPMPQVAEGTQLVVKISNFDQLTQSEDHEIISLVYNCLHARLSRPLADYPVSWAANYGNEFAVFFAGDNHAGLAQNAAEAIVKAAEASNRIPKLWGYAGLQVKTTLVSGLWALIRPFPVLDFAQASSGENLHQPVVLLNVTTRNPGNVSEPVTT